MHNKYLIPSLLSCAVASTFGVSLPAQAQKMVLEEVMVTARKKEEGIQDAPLAVSAVDRDTIEASFLGDATQIVQYSPNLVFDDISSGTPGGGGISIRGISLQDVEKTFDPTVLIHVDGVPLGTNTGNVMNLLDIERIEVLRGPQGTLFGKNAVGGVINIWRIKPILGEWAGKVRASYNDEEATSVEGVLNVPLGDTLAAKINLAHVEKAGYYDNITTGDEEGDSDEDRWGVHLLWQPTDRLLLEAQYNDSEMDGTIAPQLAIDSPQSDLCTGEGFAVPPNPGICVASPNKPLSGDRRKGAGDLKQSFELDSTDYQLNATWDVTDTLSAVVIAGHRELEEEGYYDFDGSSQALFHGYRPNDYEQDSLELRFDYDSGDRLSFSAGYFYWNSKLKDWLNEVEASGLYGAPCGLDPDLPACQIDTASGESDSDSWFFEGDFYLTDSWVLTAGARYIEETKKLTKESTLPVFGLVTLPKTSGERTDDDTIYRLGLRWEASDDIMTYASYSTGFRSGGYSIRAVSPEIVETGFEPETVDSYEIGIKTTLFDQRVRLNATYFFMEYDDMQLEVQLPREPVGTQDAVVNAGKAEMQGVELELTAILSDSFSVDFNGGYLDSEYKEFVGQIYADGSQTDDNSHLPLRRAPEWNYTAALNYLQPIGDSELRGRLSYNWRDDYAGTLTDFPRTHIDSFGVLDASLTWFYQAWQFSVYGRNLTDEDQYSHTFIAVPYTTGRQLLAFTTPRPPRTFGVEVTYSFGDY